MTTWRKNDRISVRKIQFIILSPDHQFVEKLSVSLCCDIEDNFSSVFIVTTTLTVWRCSLSVTIPTRPTQSARLLFSLYTEYTTLRHGAPCPHNLFITDMSAQHKYSFRLTMMTGWFIKSTELLNNINDIWFQFIVEVGMYLLQGTKPQYDLVLMLNVSFYATHVVQYRIDRGCDIVKKNWQYVEKVAEVVWEDLV